MMYFRPRPVHMDSTKDAWRHGQVAVHSDRQAGENIDVDLE